MKALFMSRNLIGDGLNIYPALKTWYDLHPDWEIDMLTYPDHVAEIYHHMGIPMRVVLNEDQLDTHYEFKFDFDTTLAFTIGDKQKVHIAKAYAMMLNVAQFIKPENYRLMFVPTELEPPLTEREKNLVIISPFSRSCASQAGLPPNKMLPWDKWRPILLYLRTLGPIGCLGGFSDRAPELELTEDEYFTGLSLNRVAHILDASKCVVTIDNGIAHLAAAMQTKEIVFYPACLGLHWIIPIGNKNMIRTIRLDPVDVKSIPLTLSVKDLLKSKFST